MVTENKIPPRADTCAHQAPANQYEQDTCCALLVAMPASVYTPPSTVPLGAQHAMPGGDVHLLFAWKLTEQSSEHAPDDPAQKSWWYFYSDIAPDVVYCVLSCRRSQPPRRAISSVLSTNVCVVSTLLASSCYGPERLSAGKSFGMPPARA